MKSFNNFHFFINIYFEFMFEIHKNKFKIFYFKKHILSKRKKKKIKATLKSVFQNYCEKHLSSMDRMIAGIKKCRPFFGQLFSGER